MISSIFDQFSLPKRNTIVLAAFIWTIQRFLVHFCTLDQLFLLLRIHHLFIFGPLHQVKRGTLPLLVHKDNRKGNIFNCLKCGHTDHADRVAAINLCARYDDPDITIYTPKSVVLSILQIRFTASLQRQSESAIVAAPSVSGRTALDSLPKQSETPSLNSYNEYGTEMSSAYIR